MKSSDSLVRLTPSDLLTFKLSKNAESREVLKVTNTSKSKIIFKVKTTQPSWYYVRPNQQVLDEGQSENVVIVLVEADGMKFSDLVDLSDSDRREKLEKHRFLVQTKVVSDDEYRTLTSIPVNERSDEFTKLWASGEKDDKKNLKLKVEFIVEENSATDKGKENNENLSAIRTQLNQDMFRPSGSVDTSNAEQVLTELLALRKKYDAVVEYTVHLTAERDTVVAQLDELQKEYGRDKLKRNLDLDKGNSDSIRSKDGKKSSRGQLSILVIILVGILSFILGKYLKV